ncbi:hypothetical protein [Moraxella lacunata]|nr:hypothetical protein [Moraxella lacunata]
MKKYIIMLMMAWGLLGIMPTAHAWQPATMLNSHEKVVYSSYTDKIT